MVTPSFKTTDPQGKVEEWPLVLNVGLAMDWKTYLDIDVGDPTQIAETFMNLSMNRISLAGAIWTLVEDRAKERGYEDRDFFKLFTPEVLEEAASALLECIVLFTPSRQRETIRKVIEAGMAAEQTAADKMVTFVQSADVQLEIEKRLDQALDEAKTSGELFGKSPDS